MAKKRKKTANEVEPKEQMLSTDIYANRVDVVGRRSLFCDPNTAEEHECKIGIYGWRKKFLYILIIIIAGLVVLNAALTLWIISVLNFSMSGLANMKIDSNGLTLNGNAFIDDHLFATTISSRKGQTLKLMSDQNITLMARSNSEGTVGTVFNAFSIGNSRLRAITNDFRIKGRDGQLLFGVNEDKVIINSDTLQVDNLNGFRFSRSIQTPLVQAIDHSDLKLVSPERRVNIVAPISIAMESRLGDLSAICYRDLRLKSKQGKITLESVDIELRNLPTPVLTQTYKDNLYPNVYQLCVCGDSGKIFSAPADKACAANETICGLKHNSRTIIS